MDPSLERLTIAPCSWKRYVYRICLLETWTFLLYHSMMIYTTTNPSWRLATSKLMVGLSLVQHRNERWMKLLRRWPRKDMNVSRLRSQPMVGIIMECWWALMELRGTSNLFWKLWREKNSSANTQHWFERPIFQTGSDGFFAKCWTNDVPIYSRTVVRSSSSFEAMMMFLCGLTNRSLFLVCREWWDQCLWTLAKNCGFDGHATEMVRCIS